jgi:hypothetical protein
VHYRRCDGRNAKFVTWALCPRYTRYRDLWTPTEIVTNNRWGWRGEMVRGPSEEDAAGKRARAQGCPDGGACGTLTLSVDRGT